MFLDVIYRRAGHFVVMMMMIMIMIIIIIIIIIIIKQSVTQHMSKKI